MSETTTTTTTESEQGGGGETGRRWTADWWREPNAPAWYSVGRGKEQRLLKAVVLEAVPDQHKPYYWCRLRIFGEMSGGLGTFPYNYHLPRKVKHTDLQSRVPDEEERRMLEKAQAERRRAESREAQAQAERGEGSHGQ